MSLDVATPNKSSINKFSFNSFFSFNLCQKILDKRALQELVKEVDPTEQLDDDVEDVNRSK